MSFEEAKQFLRREDESGSSLYEHLSKVLMKIIIEKPANANAMFEQLSAELRSNCDTEEIKSIPQRKGNQLEWCQAVAKLYEIEEGEGTFPDLMTEANVWEWAGIDLGKSETYRLYLSLKAKALAEGLKLRFWGKIQAQNGHYFIAQSEHPEPPERSIDLEGPEGTNKYAFYVSKHAGAAWTQLPDVTPKAIVAARQIKRFFTGDLTAVVHSYPPFPGGTEAHLLRAQIAQITADTSISPAGFYVEDEEAQEQGLKAVQKAEEIETYKSAEELKDPSSWIHHELPINVNGRCNQLPPPEEDEENEEAPAGSNDPEIEDLPILASVDNDTPADSSTPYWKFLAAPGGAGESPDSIILAKSLKWPGAVAAAFGTKFLNIYSGWGFAAGQGRSYQPPPVPPILSEFTINQEDTEEQEHPPHSLIEDTDVIIQPPIEEDEEDDEDA